jgi:selenocysteine-specific elongation factor
MAHIVVGTAGHIDHGKSALVQALTGIDPDRLKEEKERGITIELGFAHTQLEELTVAFVDVPGHERFVKTMLAGVGGMDCVLLIVAGDESVMPQTREHFDICRLLRVQHGIVVMTKSDLLDDETIELVRLEVRELVNGSFLTGAPILPVSAKTGAGLEDLRSALREVAAKVVHPRHGGVTRLPIDRAFTMQGFGTVVTGTLIGGRLGIEDELAVVPGDRQVRVRGVQVHGKRRVEAVAGQRTAVNVGGIELGDIRRGQSLITPDALTMTRRIDAVVELLPTAKPLKHGARVHFHQGTLELLGRVSLAGAETAALQPGATASVRLRFESTAALTRGDRFILRAYSPTVTIAGGQVLDPVPPRFGIRNSASAVRFADLAVDEGEAGQDVRAIARMIADSGASGLTLASLVSRAGVSPEQRSQVVATLEREGYARLAGDRLVDARLLEGLATRLLGLAAEFHKNQPLAEGIPREEARERLFARADPAVFEHVLTWLAASRRLVVKDRLSLPGHRLELAPEEERARDAVETAFKRAGLKPPDVATIAADAKVPRELAEKMSGFLVRQKTLVRIDSLIFHVEALHQLKADMQALKTTATGGRATVDVATFKDRYGVTRKFAIPLLEWLDRERVTRRVGETRLVL